MSETVGPRIAANRAICGGSALHRASVRASHPAGPGSILGVPKIVSEFLDVAEI